MSVADEQAIGDDDPPHPPEAEAEGDAEAPAKPPPSGLRRTLEWAGLIAAALLVALGVRATVVQTFYIPSESMEPTLEVGDRILVNKLSYRLHDVHRGDVVVFKRPPTAQTGPDGTDDLIKRVIGLSGETIEAREDGRVYINGKVLDEPYLPEGTQTDNLPKQTVPEGRVFVMGDNRGHSGDSRMFQAIDEDLIVGRAFVIIFPPGDAGGL